MNHVKTIFLMVILTAILLLLGNLIAGEEGMVIAFIIALAMNFFSYWFSDKIAIAMTHSKPLDESQAPMVYKALRELTENANMPMPKLYLMPTDQLMPCCWQKPKESIISVTKGLVDILEYDEIKEFCP